MADACTNNIRRFLTITCPAFICCKPDHVFKDGNCCAIRGLLVKVFITCRQGYEQPWLWRLATAAEHAYLSYVSSHKSHLFDIFKPILEDRCLKMRFLDETQTVANDDKSKGLEVIAVGQWRCATSSLQMAFEQILQPPMAPSMHGAYLMPHPHKIELLNQASREPDAQARQAILREIYTGYNASSDWPGFAFLDDILDMYADCKVILNKRASPQRWVESVKSSLEFFATSVYYIVTYLLPVSRAHHRLYTNYMQQAAKRYGVAHTTSGIFSVECYERHNQWVRSVCAARGKELLEWEPDDGWAPLCRFLGRSEPDVPFPRTNETEEIQKLKVVLIRQGLLAWIKLVGGLAVIPGAAWLFWGLWG